MRCSCDFWPDKDDPISCRTAGVSGRARLHTLITIGPIRISMTIDQVMALTDAIDGWLTDKARPEERPDEDIFERMALDQECREEG